MNAVAVASTAAGTSVYSQWKYSCRDNISRGPRGRTSGSTSKRRTGDSGSRSRGEVLLVLSGAMVIETIIIVVVAVVAVVV